MHVEDIGDGDKNNNNFDQMGKSGLIKLAKKINFYLSNPTEYNKFFDWRNRMNDSSYRFGTREAYGESGFCKACEIIRNPDQYKSWYPDLNKWWHWRDNGTRDACEINRPKVESGNE